MLERNLIIFISAVAMVLICWMIVERWFYSFGVLSQEKTSGLGSLDRINIVVEKFFDAVNRKKDFRTICLKEEMGKFQLKTNERMQEITKEDHNKKSYDSASIKRKRRYNIKEDM